MDERSRSKTKSQDDIFFFFFDGFFSPIGFGCARSEGGKRDVGFSSHREKWKRRFLDLVGVESFQKKKKKKSG